MTIFSLWPKGNGDDHLVMFRKMITGDTKALVCWGQNPAVTEPNQSAIRAGLKNLDLLVVHRHVRDRDRGVRSQGRERDVPDSRRLARRDGW